MPGRTHRAAPGEPACPAPGCERPAGFATPTPGRGPCRRHASQLARPTPRPGPSPAPPKLGDAPDGGPASPLAHRLTGPGHPNPDPLAVVRLLLGAARRAGFAFEPAWRLAAEAALSYMSDRHAAEWWGALDATREAWEGAYTGRASRLAGWAVREVIK